MKTQTSALSPAAVGPLAAHERIVTVDMLRGFALFGILLVNMALFKAPAISQASATTSTSLLDQIAAQAINIFAEGKFFTLFSFLFGLGFSLQLLRAQQRGQPFAPFYLRRLLVLLLIGIAHATLLWYGDILVSYALIGAGIVAVELQRADPVGGSALIAAEREQLRSAEAEIARDTVLYRDGSYAELVATRTFAPVGLIYNLVTQGIPILAMFLLGLYAGKRGILADVPAHRTLLRHVRFWGLLLGLLFSVMLVIAQVWLSLFAGFAALLLAQSLTGPLLALGYAATVVLLAENPAVARDSRPWGSREDGADELSPPDADLHDDLLRLRRRAFRGGRRGTRCVADGRNLPAPAAVERMVAEALSVWPRGMAVANTDVWPRPAAAATGPTCRHLSRRGSISEGARQRGATPVRSAPPHRQACSC